MDAGIRNAHKNGNEKGAAELQMAELENVIINEALQISINSSNANDHEDADPDLLQETLPDLLSNAMTAPLLKYNS